MLSESTGTLQRSTHVDTCATTTDTSAASTPEIIDLSARVSGDRESRVLIDDAGLLSSSLGSDAESKDKDDGACFGGFLNFFGFHGFSGS